MKYISFKLPLIASILFSVLVSCQDEARVYEYNYVMSQNNWAIDTIPSFSFEIDQPQKEYNVYVNIRNTIGYPYYNLFVNYQLCDSLGIKLKGQQIEMMLLDPKTGRPLGKGVGDLFFHQFPVLNNYSFPYKGKYKIKVIQYMRINPLPEIMSAGVRVEEVIR